VPRVSLVDADKISDEAAAAVAEVWQTVNGALRLKLHDKQRAPAKVIGLMDALRRSVDAERVGGARGKGERRPAHHP
jgi:non-homologous end joining protein Ku